ncbi:hypothetical protein [Methylomonas rosea]|uniref:Secreted protein n=1 Tax=Methylomonas rosea TaxID=2952227 RepID=A0ABT1TS03_9GAMM|nr:hypothetical protein [Methylomonas sp. WSC-7]MCQ8117257.1 hypothetical protein [Methylomonas sp. WSC-7]
MKTLLSLKLWLAVCLFAVSTVSSAGIIWESTSEDSEFFAPSFLTPSSETFGIFSAGADLSSAAPLETFTGFKSYGSASPFKLALWTTSGWISESGSLAFSGDDYLLSFLKPGLLTNNLVLLYGVDIKAAADQNPVSGVPLPASVWFMTSALLGFLYTGRRKAAVQA